MPGLCRSKRIIRRFCEKCGICDKVRTVRMLLHDLSQKIPRHLLTPVGVFGIPDNGKYILDPFTACIRRTIMSCPSYCPKHLIRASKRSPPVRTYNSSSDAYVIHFPQAYRCPHRRHINKICIDTHYWLKEINHFDYGDKKLLRRLVHSKYDVVDKAGVSPATKDASWRKLTREFNRVLIGSYKTPRSMMELRMQWEKMTEKEFSKTTRRLWRSMCGDKARTTRTEQRQRKPRYADYNYVVTEFSLMESSDEEEDHVDKRTTTVNEEASFNDANTEKTETIESNNFDVREVNRIETQICEIDAEFWNNKIERINAQCEMTGNKN